MGDLKIKLDLNGGTELLDLAGRENLARSLFDYLLEQSSVFDCNDDGTRFDCKEKLDPFRASSDQNAEMCSFNVDEKSVTAIKELFDKLENAPHTKWGLHGEGFSLEYSECGDDSSEEEGVVECFKIMAGGKILEKINELARSPPKA